MFTFTPVSGVSDKDEDYQAWVEKQLQLSIAPFPKFQILEMVVELEKLIADFPIENATPMEALMFVNKLKTARSPWQCTMN